MGASGDGKGSLRGWADQRRAGARKTSREALRRRRAMQVHRIEDILGMDVHRIEDVLGMDVHCIEDILGMDVHCIEDVLER
jgi:hypothetical protein